MIYEFMSLCFKIHFPFIKMEQNGEMYIAVRIEITNIS